MIWVLYGLVFYFGIGLVASAIAIRTSAFEDWRDDELFLCGLIGVLWPGVAGLALLTIIGKAWIYLSKKLAKIGKKNG